MQKKLFSAEIKQFGSTTPMELGPVSDGINGLQFQNMMEALNDIKAMLGETDAVEPSAEEVVEVKASAELEILRNELQELSDVILETRREIASLSSSKTGQKLVSVTDQLDAVVGDTETATNTILEAVETIEDKSESLELHASSPEEVESLEAIGKAVMKIYEACNFQDVTGQRISKVVATLGFVDERISKMIDILGGEDELEVLDIAELKPQFDEDVELSGPQPEGHEISQDEIDSLFD
jgi:chemotaxis protein CheZ|tara:strand:+ start:2518 stop:3237 length:720 start_codon:yes stop_codon:yes gene_type:complete